MHAAGGRVVINPGGDTSECFMNASDVIMNAENSFAAYSQPYSMACAILIVCNWRVCVSVCVWLLYARVCM